MVWKTSLGIARRDISAGLAGTYLLLIDTSISHASSNFSPFIAEGFNKTPLFVGTTHFIVFLITMIGKALALVGYSILVNIHSIADDCQYRRTAEGWPRDSCPGLDWIGVRIGTYASTTTRLGNRQVEAEKKPIFLCGSWIKSQHHILEASAGGQAIFHRKFAGAWDTATDRVKHGSLSAQAELSLWSEDQ